MISLEDLNRLLAKELQTALQPPEAVALEAALGRVLAEDVQSSVNIPSDNVSAMDGYAVLADAALAAGETLTVVGESIAGRPFAGQVRRGECVRIMTGAVVPEGADSIVMQEHVQRSGEKITLTRGAAAKENIRYAGEELAQGEIVLRRGQRLQAADILLLASVGRASVLAAPRLKAAVFSTGDELVPAGSALTKTGQIYDSNRPLLKALLQDLPVEVQDFGLIADEPAQIEAALAQAAAQCDVIITSGGVSVGDYDFLKGAVEKLGEIRQYKVKMKPGKPFVYGKIGKAWYFGLPGNPVSGFVGFQQIIAPALWRLAGAEPPLGLALQLPLAAAVHKTPGRQDFQRGVMRMGASGWEVQPQGRQDSHRVYGLARANCFIVLEAEEGSKAAGECVTVIPFPSHFGTGLPVC